MSATTPNELQKSAKAVVGFIFLVAAAIVAYPDVLPLHGNIKTAITTACVFLGTIAIWLKKNAPNVKADAEEVESMLKDLGVAVPQLSDWADETLAVLGAQDEPVDELTSPPVVPPVVVVDDTETADPPVDPLEDPVVLEDDPVVVEDDPETVSDDPIAWGNPDIPDIPEDAETEPVDPLV